MDRRAAARNRALLDWYRARGRDLPWRRDRDPWRVLVSEVMLQQTQAARVAPAFARFVGAFPTPRAAAAVTPDRLVAAWVGLGYHARARRLHAAAGRITAGGWPTTVEGLRRLPGVGSYTAAAVASIAFGRRVAAVDTNVRRVLSRWVGRPLTGAELAAVAAGLVAGDAASWNQAVMDLGATVCRPEPRCGECPVAAWCADPAVYTPPPAQRPYHGSQRQVRGAIVRALADDGWMDRGRLAARLGLPAATLSPPLDRLVAEGMLERSGRRVRLSRQGG